MRVTFMGTPDFSVPVLDALVAAGHEIACVYTQPPRPAGRGKKDRPTPVHARAEELGLMVRHPKTLRTEEQDVAFASLDPDVAVVVAYGLILPRQILEAPCRGCLNIHASLLPRWRGAAPIHRAIMAGDTETGVCIMRMEEGLDTGPVLLREATPIGPEDTTGELHDRLSAMGARLIVEALEKLRDLPPQDQPGDGVTYAAKIDKAEARVDWTRPAPEVARHINGLSPFPGAWCDVAGERLKLLRARAVEGTAAPGTVLGGLTVACGEGAVEILEAQRQGKRPMRATEILRGFPLPERLG
ncbi:methionyl-tRNA formyltransferase [Rhodovulum sulfidophilum]|uniref:Methionyl-tRNA formyltransferase n=1 Tax=Rhodovulum visakhapatnamense TaxID=364297 RepID=A0ABS1RD05_9RHOB|nr:methionyl-tRNA formyltransferase [Rhodovulum visakhapatnamense]MBL3571389.1 methionyl-tRNA formyltransferase [Rhodovulum visakhapatnamense]MBL3577400.1 methionyl-tRNA formyltransferase [Rhodovulum visakhapatnamense]OLS43388.1 methionyl-tRNA formyltransferase [Rhodovulum sulfidophilum]